jgi:hypothetical protein
VGGESVGEAIAACDAPAWSSPPSWSIDVEQALTALERDILAQRTAAIRDALEPAAPARSAVPDEVCVGW